MATELVLGLFASIISSQHMNGWTVALRVCEYRQAGQVGKNQNVLQPTVNTELGFGKWWLWKLP